MSSPGRFKVYGRFVGDSILGMLVKVWFGLTGRGAMQASLPTGFREAPEPLSNGYDWSWNWQTSLLPVCGLQILGGGVTLPQRGKHLVVFNLTFLSQSSLLDIQRICNVTYIYFMAIHPKVMKIFQSGLPTPFFHGYVNRRRKMKNYLINPLGGKFIFFTLLCSIHT